MKETETNKTVKCERCLKSFTYKICNELIIFTDTIILCDECLKELYEGYKVK